MQKRIVGVLTMMMIVFFALPAMAGTRDDCIAKCQEAANFYQLRGFDATVKEIKNKGGKFVWNDGVSYVFMMDMDAQLVAHPFKSGKNNGKNPLDTADANGKQYRRDFIKAAEKGKGWTQYVYEVPGMDTVKPKHTYIYRIPDTNYFVAAGFYVLKAGVYR